MSKQPSIQSMTGFATIHREVGTTALTLELRSVNARFLDLTFKMPDDLRSVEPLVRELIGARIGRGKVECRIGWLRRPAADRQPVLDRGLLARLGEAAATIQQALPQAAPVSVSDLLRWPGVWVEERDDPQQLQQAIGQMTREALDEFVASRAREGAKLAATLRERADAIDRIVERLEQRLPELLAQFEQRLTDRLRAALADATQGSAVPMEETFARIRQEVSLHGMRIDLAEELARLKAHTSEVRRILQAGGAAGKRLDFLMQELNREANTVGSKAAASEVTAGSVEMKLLIEQMREQVQNIE